MSTDVTLADIVAALEVTYTEAGVVTWLYASHRSWACSPMTLLHGAMPDAYRLVCEAVRSIGDADPQTFADARAVVSRWTDCDGLITNLRNANNAAEIAELRAENERMRAAIDAVLFACRHGYTYQFATRVEAVLAAAVSAPDVP